MGDFLIYFVLSIVAIIIIYIIFTYFNLKKQQKKLVEVQETLKVNTEVIISGGIYGRIKHLDQQYAKIEIADGVVIKVERYAIRTTA